MIDKINSQVSDLVNSGKTKEALTFVKEIISNCILVASGLCFTEGYDEEAVSILENGISFSTDHNIYNNLGVLYIQAEQYTRAEECLKKASVLFESNADVLYNYGVTLKNLGKFDEALIALENCLKLNPTSSAAHCVIAEICAGLGQFERYFEEDWHRFNLFSLSKNTVKSLDKPFWDGTEGKTILVFHDQGVGDLIQFSRYIKFLKEANSTVILQVSKGLKTLFESLEGVDCVIVELGNIKFDYIIPVTLLPYYFDAKLDNIPLSNSYLKSSPVQRMVLPIDNSFPVTRKRIGICWAGNPKHTRDYQRSCPLKYFRPLFDLDCCFVALQGSTSNLRAWAKNVDLLDDTHDLRYVSPQLNDYNETASVIDSLDLVISVDTGVAHLAGALGKPVWLLTHYLKEWRWRKTWYPNMRIFSQKTPDDWKNLLIEVADQLKVEYAN